MTWLSSANSTSTTPKPSSGSCHWRCWMSSAAAGRCSPACVPRAVWRLPPQDAATGQRLARLVHLAGDIAALDKRIKATERDLARLVKACGSTLTEEVGIGVVTAATLLREVGDPTRFRRESNFGRWNGSAAVAVSSGEGDDQPTRHRL